MPVSRLWTILLRTARAAVVAGLGSLIVLGASAYVAGNWNSVYGAIYWTGGEAMDDYFTEVVTDVGARLTYATRITVNSQPGRFFVAQKPGDLTSLSDVVRSRLEQASPGKVYVGHGANICFIIARGEDRLLAMLLFKDMNINEVIVMGVTVPVSVLVDNRDPLADADGLDPRPSLRPPGAQRVMCFEIPGMAVAAYKSFHQDIGAIYQNMPQTEGLMSATRAFSRKPAESSQGDLFFFDSSDEQRGFVAYQRVPEEESSYVLVCAQKR